MLVNSALLSSARALTPRVRRSARGLTLLELIVVFVILLILAVGAIVSYQSTQRHARTEALKSSAYSLDHEATALAALREVSPHDVVSLILTEDVGVEPVSMSGSAVIVPLGAATPFAGVIPTAAGDTGAPQPGQEWLTQQGTIRVNDDEGLEYSAEGADTVCYLPSLVPGANPGIVRTLDPELGCDPAFPDGASGGPGGGGGPGDGGGGPGDGGDGGGTPVSVDPADLPIFTLGTWGEDMAVGEWSVEDDQWLPHYLAYDGSDDNSLAAEDAHIVQVAETLSTGLAVDDSTVLVPEIWRYSNEWMNTIDHDPTGPAPLFPFDPGTPGAVKIYNGSATYQARPELYDLSVFPALPPFAAAVTEIPNEFGPGKTAYLDVENWDPYYPSPGTSYEVRAVSSNGGDTVTCRGGDDVFWEMTNEKLCKLNGLTPNSDYTFTITGWPDEATPIALGTVSHSTNGAGQSSGLPGAYGTGAFAATVEVESDEGATLTLRATLDGATTTPTVVSVTGLSVGDPMGSESSVGCTAYSAPFTCTMSGAQPGKTYNITFAQFGGAVLGSTSFAMPGAEEPPPPPPPPPPPSGDFSFGVVSNDGATRTVSATAGGSGGLMGLSVSAVPDGGGAPVSCSAFVFSRPASCSLAGMVPGQTYTVSFGQIMGGSLGSTTYTVPE